MQNKLQELTDKLYNEGLAKGKQDAENLVASAREEADKIVAEAKRQAAKILADAARQAEDLKARTEGDIKMASTKAVAALRQQIEQMVSARAIGAGVDATMADRAFVAELISTVAGAFNASGEAAPLEVILPQAMKSQLEAFLAGNIDKALAEGMTFSFSDAFTGGFRISPKDGGYYLDFTDESFKALLGEYLRPSTRKILFG